MYYQTDCSHAQKRLLNFSLLGKQDANLNITAALEFSSELNIEKLKLALQGIIDQNDILRTTYTWDLKNSKDYKCFVHDRLELELNEKSVICNASVSVQKIIDQFTLIQQTRKIDLVNLPNFTFTLIHIYSDKKILRNFIFLATFHHILMDDWSINLFLKQLISNYKTINSNHKVSIKNTSPQYQQYITHEQEHIKSEKYTYRINSLVESLKCEELDNSNLIFKGSSNLFNSDSTHLHFDIATSNRIYEYCKSNKISLFHFFMSVYAITLAKFLGKHDIYIGFPIAGRYVKDQFSMLGTFVNILVLKVTLNNDLNFEMLCHHVKSSSLELYSYQDIPFDCLVNEMRRKHVFDIDCMLSMQSIDSVDEVLPEQVHVKRHFVADLIENYNMLLSVNEVNDTILLTFKHNTHYLNSDIVASMKEFFSSMLDYIIRS